MYWIRLSLLFGLYFSFAKGKGNEEPEETNEPALAKVFRLTLGPKLFNIPNAIDVNLKILPNISKELFPNLISDDDTDCNNNVEVTGSPTQGPALEPVSPTPLPSHSPTALPSSSPSISLAPTLRKRISLSCPEPGESIQVPENSVLSLNTASSDTFCSLNYKSLSRGEEIITPVGRSYNENAWEAVPGPLRMTFECTDSECVTDIPETPRDDEDSYFQLTTLDRGNITSQDLASRFLEQVTFGITRADLEPWSDVELTSYSDLDDSFADWVDDQINNKEETSHRKLFRERISTRASGSKLQAVPNHPCDANTRWRSYAVATTDYYTNRFRDRDIFEIEETNDGSAYLVLFDGKPLTEITDVEILEIWQGPAFNLTVPATLELCTGDWAHEELVGGRLCIYYDGRHRHFKVGNPEVKFDSVNGKRPDNVIQLDASVYNDFVQLPGNDRPGEELLNPNSITHSMCDKLSLADYPVFIEFSDGKWLVFDRRIQFMDNLPESPAPNGGVDAYTRGSYCPNAYRTFMNVETCVLSDEPACTNEGENTDFEIPLNSEDIVGLHTLSDKYVYAVKDIRPDYSGNPCIQYQRSRWLRIGDDESCTRTSFNDETNITLSELIEDALEDGDGVTSQTVDILYRNTNDDCSIPVTQNFTADPVYIISEGSCYELVHPDLHSVFDFTPWVSNHPGMAPAITQFAEDGDAFLSFPSHHVMSQWDQGENYRYYVGRLNQTSFYRDLPPSLQLDSILEEYGYSSFETNSRTLLCGSVNEVANDHTLGDTGFVSHIGDELEETPYHEKSEQKYNLWTEIALFSEDQLRQRVAWALSQIFAISQEAVNVREHTEDFLYYYDIFVRNSFGNYFDILKEVSYSGLMADMLTYMRSQSTAYTLQRYGVISFADENYAREIMQLFTIGTVMLNMDGSQILDDNGNPILTYTNDHIMSYARAWTGFDRHSYRGNIETSMWRPNNIDPMQIIEEWRDVFPKINLNEGHVGDAYPLCVDLPSHHFLRKGAIYRLLGSDNSVQLQESLPWWYTYETDVNITLDENNSELFAKLCNDPSNTGECSFLSQVVLDENLECNDRECNVDTLRIVQVTEGIWFEYLRQPCVELAYYNDAKVINDQHRYWRRDMCANPKLEAAGEACCLSETDNHGYGANCEYTFEKMTFDTNVNRCEDIGQTTCDWYWLGVSETNPDRNPNPQCHGFWRFPHWVDTECLLKVKVEGKSGKAAIVHDSQSIYWEEDNDLNMQENVRQSTPNFFPVYWQDEDFPSFDNNCGEGTCASVFDGCLCNTTVIEEAVFVNSGPTTVQDVMESLFIGSVSPDTFDESYYDDPVTQGDVVVFFRAGTGQSYDIETIFMVEYLDKIYYFKNMRSTVVILDQSGSETPFAFRNPPHFLDLEYGDQRDAHYETEAVLESYFYHPNVPPFLAIHFINRFGISNPSPRYVKAVATAFKTGTYEYVKNSDSSTMSFGSNKYGNLEATIAAVILDREARSIVLDSDPTFGGMKEPLLKVISLLRSMEYAPEETRISHRRNMVFRYMTTRIGQMTHDYQSIFSFFRREFSPTGLVQQGNLVAPEAQRYNSPNIISLMNGLYLLIKFGLNGCYGGFGHNIPYRWCRPEGDYSSSYGHLSFSPEQSDMESVVDELALLLTANRLGSESRSIISNIASQAEDKGAGIRIAQQLVISTPEFHTTSLMENSGLPRDIPDPPEPSERPYKAVVVMLTSGGLDSFNLFVPHSNCDTDMYVHYVENRGNVHIPYSQLGNTIFPAQTNQVCENFAVHPDLPILKTLYDEDSLAFFANTGVLQEYVDRDNWYVKTNTQLFAHNVQQRDVQQVGLVGTQGTGISGRMADTLTAKGFQTGSFSFAGENFILTGQPSKSPTPIFLNAWGGLVEFNPQSSMDDMNSMFFDLNNLTTSFSGKFGKTWADIFDSSIRENIYLREILEDIELATDFPNSNIGMQLEMTSTVMKAKDDLGNDRQFFFLNTGGWDTHSNQAMSDDVRIPELNDAMAAFVDEMKEQGLWDDIILFEISDFARTMATNSGEGTDHAWGGNYFMFGGGVKSQMLGTYPSDLSDQGELNIGNGRLIPTTAFEEIWNSIAQWMGVDDPSSLDEVIPGRNNFNLFSESDIFKP